MFRAPQWHGATQTHFPPRPCKSAGHRRGFESRFESAKRAFRPRLPPKVTRQVSKTSVSYETSSKTHMSKSAKRAFRTRLPPKNERKHPSEHTHHAALPSSFAIPAPPNNTRSHANPNVTQRRSPLPSDNVISCELQQTLKTLKADLRCNTLKRKPQWRGHIQHPKNTTLQSQWNCAENCGSHKTLRLHSEIILHTSASYIST